MSTRMRHALIKAPDGSWIGVVVTVCPPSRRRAAGSIQRAGGHQRPQRGARHLAREAGLADIPKEEAR